MSRNWQSGGAKQMSPRKGDDAKRARKKHAGLVGGTPALPVIEAAAAAVGISTEQLINLVADAGVISLPPSDDATEQMTLRELGEHLRAQMSTQSKLELPKWFKGLAKVQRGALVISLRADGASTTSIASSFQVPAMEVMRTFNEFADKIGQNVTNVRLTTIVGSMQLVAERAQAGAATKADWSTYWRIQKDLIGLLQSLGIVDKAVHRTEVMHTLGDREKENLERLAMLRLKEQRRDEEIQEIKVTVDGTEAIPKEFIDEE